MPASVFFSDLGPPMAAPSDGVMDFTKGFGNTGHDLFVSRHLNAAQKLWPARPFVMAFRDPGETDAIGRVIVGPSVATGTPFTNSGVIRVNPNAMFNEGTLTHEYAHFAQESIGAYYLLPSYHDGCEVRDVFGVTVNSPEFAWFEGFPGFFSRALRMYHTDEYMAFVSPQTSLQGYAPTICPVLGTPDPNGQPITPDAIEKRVEEALFLLITTASSRSAMPALLEEALRQRTGNARCPSGRPVSA